ncbi:MAG: hypothetical protein ACLVKE_01690 [Clostridium baratii]
MNYKDKYNDWLENDLFDEIIKKELREIKEFEKNIMKNIVL